MYVPPSTMSPPLATSSAGTWRRIAPAARSCPSRVTTVAPSSEASAARTLASRSVTDRPSSRCSRSRPDGRIDAEGADIAGRDGPRSPRALRRGRDGEPPRRARPRGDRRDLAPAETAAVPTRRFRPPATRLDTSPGGRAGAIRHAEREHFDAVRKDHLRIEDRAVARGEHVTNRAREPDLVRREC